MTGLGLVGRRQARLILFAVVAIDVLLALLVLTAPAGLSGPMRAPVSRGFPVGSVIVAIGVGLHLVGFVWMIRIYRADPEARPSSWRAFRR